MTTTDELATLEAQARDLHDAVREVEGRLAREHFETTEETRGFLTECRRNLRWAAADLVRAREKVSA